MFPTPWRSCPAQPLSLKIPEEAAVLICGDCNARNNDGERFCSNCGAYLVWQQTHADAEDKGPERTTAAGRGPAVTTAQLPVIAEPSRATAPGPGGAAREQPTTAPANPTQATQVRPDAPPSAAPNAGKARISASDSFGAAAAAYPPAQADLGERQPRQAAGRPRQDPETQPRRSEVQQIPGGLTCRRCGADNKPEGSFCRQCGASLKEVAVVPVPPWWRQLLGRTTPAALPAGSRPQWRKQRRLSTGTVSLLTVMAMFAGAAFLGRDVIVAAVLRAVDEIMEKPIPAQNMTASNFAPERNPDLARDGSAVHSWASNGPGDAGGAYLEARFDAPFRLTYVVIDGGASSLRQDFEKERRPAKVEIIATRDDGSRSTLTVDLTDVSSSQNFYVGADRVTTVRLNILETKGPPGARVSVAEVRFAGR
jgi:ribosomal protein L40E